MSTAALAWSALSVYAAITATLAYRGWRRTRSLESFAVGNGDIAPWVVGLSLSAQLTSVATFVVNPGLVYAYGLSGLLGFGVAAAGGITLGLVLFSKAFRRVGAQVTALTVPQWIGARYRSKPLALGFGVLSLALVTFAVLIVVALAHVLAALLGVPAWAAAAGVIAFVFTYVLLGGVNTHAYTNAVQAVIMLVVALVLLVAIAPSLWHGEGVFAQLRALDPALVQPTNPASPYFRNWFEVFACNALVGMALVCQPHILSKALYLREDRHLKPFLGVAIAAGVVFLSVLAVGLVARTAIPAGTPIDQVVPTYIATRFGPALQVVISIGLLCAGISTLEGILLALSTITSVDLFLGGLAGRLLPHRDDAGRARAALWVGRASIVALGVGTFALARWQIAHPTGGSVAIFGQLGVYLLITASCVPLCAGMFLPRARRGAVVAGALASVAAYALVGLLGITAMANNPAFLATCGIAAGWGVFGVGQWWLGRRERAEATPRAGALRRVA